MGIAKDHLSESERAGISRELFEVKSEEKDGELHGLCPIHGETNPSFSYNYVKDYFNCFSCKASGDLAGLWSQVKGYADNTEGFKAFCHNFNIPIKGGDKNKPPPPPLKTKRREFGTGQPIKEPTPQKTPAALDTVWEKMIPLPPAWRERLLTVRGWTSEAIDALDIRLQTYYQKKGTDELVKIKKPERIAIPIRDQAGNVQNIRLYKVGAKSMKIISWGKGFGTSRLFPANAKPGQDPVLLCEGEQDTICAISNGFNAITQTSKTKHWKTTHKRPFNGRDVVIAYDADQAGQVYAALAANNLHGIAKSIKMLEWPDFMGKDGKGDWPEDHGQDLTDFFVKHQRTAGDLEALVAAAVEFTPDQTGSDAPLPDYYGYGPSGRLSFKPVLLADDIRNELTILTDPITGLAYRWNKRFWEIYSDDHIRKTCITRLGDDATKNHVEDTTYIVLKDSVLPHGKELNAQEDWLCLRNCMLQIDGLRIRHHSKDDYCTYELGVEFKPNSKKTCSAWIKFLKESVQTPEAIMQLQEFAGLCLTRDTKQGKGLFLFGPGSDGKSIFIKTLRKMVGIENCSAVSFKDLEDQFHRSSIFGKLLNISTEVGSKALESPYFKAIATGDPINAAFKHRTPFTFTPYCKLIFAANKMPRVLDNSDGFFRRILPVSFKQQFMGEDDDKTLEDQFEAELSQIFEWSLVGLMRLRENGRFTDCQETQELMLAYKRLNNPVLCFIEDKCVVDSNVFVEKNALYEEYKLYCTEFNYAKYNKENYFRELNAAINNLVIHRPRIDGKRPRIIHGIGLNTEIA